MFHVIGLSCVGFHTHAQRRRQQAAHPAALGKVHAALARLCAIRCSFGILCNSLQVWHLVALHFVTVLSFAGTFTATNPDPPDPVAAWGLCLRVLTTTASSGSRTCTSSERASAVQQHCIYICITPVSYITALASTGCTTNRRVQGREQEEGCVSGAVKAACAHTVAERVCRCANAGVCSRGMCA